MKKIMFLIISLLIFFVAFPSFAETKINPQKSTEQMKTFKGLNLMQWVKKATSFEKSGKHNKAIDAYSNAIKLCPNDESKGIVYFYKAVIYTKLANEALSASDKEKYLQLAKNDLETAAKLGNKGARDLLNKNTKSYASKNNNIVRLSCSMPELNFISEYTVDYDAKTVDGGNANITDEFISFTSNDGTVQTSISRYTGRITQIFDFKSKGLSSVVYSGQCNKVSNQKKF